jgi:hypothetical protein
MDIELIYPTINLFQYNLRQGLGDDDAQILARSQSFYRKFLPDNENLQSYRDREQPDREFNELLQIDPSSHIYQPLAPGLDGFYYPVQLGDAYALHLNYSGKIVKGKQDKIPKNFNTAIVNLKDELERERKLPALDGNSFGQTWLVSAFVDNTQSDKLTIAESCDRQITNKSSSDLNRSIIRGEWMGGEIFEFWTPPLSYQDNLQKIVNRHPHTIVWLFPAEKLDEIDRDIIPKSYQHWMRLCHYRHKIFYAYYQSQFIKEKLKIANTKIRNIGDSLRAKNSSLPHLQYLLFDNLQECQLYSDCAQSLEDQQHTIEVDRDNYRLRCEEMIKENPHSNLQFLLEFETKYSSKYERQIRADRAHLDSGLMMLGNLSQAIQSTIQIEQTKSDRTTNLTIATAGIGLAVSQVVCAIVLTQDPPVKIKNSRNNQNTDLSHAVIDIYNTFVDVCNTSAFKTSLSSAIPILILVLIHLGWVKIRSYKSR